MPMTIVPNGNMISFYAIQKFKKYGTTIIYVISS